MKKRWVALLVVTVVFLICCVVGYIDQDIKYPQVQYRTYTMHEPFELNGYEFEVEDAKTYDFKKFAQEHSLTLAELNLDAGKNNMQVLMVKVKATNISSEPKSLNFSQLMISSKDKANVLELVTFMQLHDDYSDILCPTLQPQESAEIELPFVESGIYWGVTKGDILDEAPLQVVFKLYPEKFAVRLNDLW